MHKISEFIIKRKRLILIFTAILIAFSIVSMLTLTKINSDITSYLPKGTFTSDGQQFLRDNYGIVGDLIVVIGDKSYDETKNIVKSIEQKEGVTSVNWIGASTFQMLKMLYPDKYAEIEKIFVSEKDDGSKMYLLIMTLSLTPSSPEAFSLCNEISDELESKGASYSLSGSTILAKDVFDSTINEIWKYLICAIIVVLIILLATTRSFVEPLILMLTLGIAILLNMGTNFIYKDVSIITYSAASILQLGMTMDYAIFMIHRYRREYDAGLSPNDAIRNTIPNTFTTILSSCLTTIGGFAALFFMQFTIGADLAKVLIKGIVLSFMAVIIIEPCFILVLHKLGERTKHPCLDLHFKKSTAFTIKHRFIFVALAIIAFLPSLLFQSKLEFNYMKYIEPPTNPTSEYIFANKMCNQLMVSVPISVDNLDMQYELIEKLNENDNIEFVLGVCTMMDKNTVSGILSGSAADNDMLKSYVNNGYTIYTVGLNVGIESVEAQRCIGEIHDTLYSLCGDQKFYTTGTAQAVVDFADITPVDFIKVNLFSSIIVMIILFFALKRNIIMTLLLIILIQFGIWINLGISYLFQGNINFMSYIIISSIQMGATIDYAILISSEYLKYRKQGLYPRNAAFQAVTKNAMAVVISVSIMMGACLSVYFVSSNLIVGEITLLIARGSLISCILVLLLLPTVLTVGRSLIDRINALRNPDFDDEDDENININD